MNSIKTGVTSRHTLTKPAILDSWLRQYNRRVAVYGIPVGDTLEKRAIAVAAMRNLPPPCEVIWAGDNSDDSINEVADRINALLDGKLPNGVTVEGWGERMSMHRGRIVQINVDLEEVAR